MSNYSGDITLTFFSSEGAQEAANHLEEFSLDRIFGWAGAYASDVTEPEQTGFGSPRYQFQVFFTSDAAPSAELITRFLTFGDISEIQFWWTDSDLLIREELRYELTENTAGRNPVPVDHYYYRAEHSVDNEYEMEELYQRCRGYEELYVARPENGTPTIGSILNSIKRHRRLL